MPLAFIVDKLDSIPEPQRALYVQDGDKFKLDVSDLPPQEDTTGLKTALQKERDGRKALETKIKAWEKSGKTPDEISEMVATAEAAALEAQKKAGNFDTILAQHKATWEKDKGVIVAERDAAFTSERGAIIENRVMTALTKAKATTEGMDLLTERLGKRIHIETVEGKRVTTIMQSDGKTPLAGSGTDGAATYDDLVNEAKKSWPSLFEGTGAAGGGKQPGKEGGKPGEKTMLRAEWDKLNPYEQAAKIKAGIKPVD